MILKMKRMIAIVRAAAAIAVAVIVRVIIADIPGISFARNHRISRICDRLDHASDNDDD